jgi:hypothetical protein
MQGEAALVSDEGATLGTWSQSREDVTMWVDYFSNNNLKLKRDNVNVVLEPNLVTINYKREESSPFEVLDFSNPEFEEVRRKRNAAKA